MTFSEISAKMASSGRLTSTLNCWATRTSVERAETAVPTETPQPASNGGEEQLDQHMVTAMIAASRWAAIPRRRCRH